MSDFPSIHYAEDASTVTEDGHLWLLERVDGYPVRFGVEGGGWLAFGGPEREFGDSPPPQYRPAVRHVRETIDRAVLEEIPSDAVFYGVATIFRRIPYDWTRLPPFLGTDVRSDGEFLPPDAVERAFERLGLAAVDAFEKEVAARHFTVSSYEVPDSEWYDGPPLGVVIRNKAGGRALLNPPGFDPESPDPLAVDPVPAAEQATTPDRIEAAILELEAEGRDRDFDAIRERALERVIRADWGAITAAGRPADPDAVVDAIEGATREYLVAERPELVGEG